MNPNLRHSLWILATGFVAIAASAMRDRGMFKHHLPACYESIDGYVTSMHVVEGVVVMAYAGNGQACYDGRVSWHGKDGQLIDAIHLGENSQSAKEQGIYSSSPRVGAVVDADRLFINLICEPQFPAVGDGGATGNVILYDRSTGIAQNLTQCSYDSGKYIRALAWFPQKRMLLCEESDLGASATASPEPGTGKPVILQLDNGDRILNEQQPDLLDWYGRFHRTHECRHSRSLPSALAQYPLMNGFHLDCDDGAITLVQEDRGINIPLAQGFVVSVDLARGRFTYATTRDDDDPHRFYLFDIDEYLKYLRSAFGASHGDREGTGSTTGD